MTYSCVLVSLASLWRGFVCFVSLSTASFCSLFDFMAAGPCAVVVSPPSAPATRRDAQGSRTGYSPWPACRLSLWTRRGRAPRGGHAATTTRTARWKRGRGRTPVPVCRSRGGRLRRRRHSLGDAPSGGWSPHLAVPRPTRAGQYGIRRKILSTERCHGTVPPHHCTESGGFVGGWGPQRR